MPTDPETLLSIASEINAIADDLRRPDSAIKRYIAESNAAMKASLDLIQELPTPELVFVDETAHPRPPMRDRPPRVHLFYNTNPIHPDDPSYAEEMRRPDNDYLCGYLKWRLDRLAHARLVAMSAAVLEGFAHVPAEVTCSACWDTITALTISMGRFAKALRIDDHRIS